MARTQPIGIELVKMGVVTEDNVTKALDYQREHPSKKLGDIIKELKLCDENLLIKAIGEILDENAINLTANDIKIDITKYLPIEKIREFKAIPFEIEAGKIKVDFPKKLWYCPVLDRGG